MSLTLICHWTFDNNDTVLSHSEKMRLNKNLVFTFRNKS